MNSKIESEISVLNNDYKIKLQEILGDKVAPFNKLHELFVEDYFSEVGAPKEFFL